MKKNKINNIIVIITMVILIILVIGLARERAIWKKGYEDMFDTKKYYKSRANDFVNKYNRYLNFFQGEPCANRTFKSHIELQYVPNWLSNNYTCDISRITSEQPDNTHEFSKWNSSIDCYKCS